jgi:hypothetical protein
MATATKRWSDYRVGSQSAVIAFDVIDAVTAEQARAACGVGLNSAHPENSNFKVDSWDATREGFTVWRLTFSYSIPENGESHDTGTDGGDGNPLAQPPVYEITRGSKTIPVDRDRDGKPIVNSAGDPFDPPLTVTRATRFLSVRRYEPTPFNLSQADEYLETVNSQAWLIQGLNIQPGAARCVDISPVGEYAAGAKYLLVNYAFEIDKDGFQPQVMDLGLRSWAVIGGDTVKAELIDGTETQISNAVRLNGKGKPMEASLKAFNPNSRQAVACVQNPQVPANLGAKLDPSGLAWFLNFKLIREKDFRLLGL